MNVKASSGSVVPSQTKRQRRAVELRLEDAGICGADAAVDAVGTDEQIALPAQRSHVIDFVLKLEHDAQLGGATLQDLQQMFA